MGEEKGGKREGSGDTGWVRLIRTRLIRSPT